MQIWQKFKFGIFDIDGTIFDNMPLSADAFCAVLKNFNLPEKDARKIYLETNGMNLSDQLKLVLEKYKKYFDDAVIKTLSEKFFQIRDNSPGWKNSPLFPGIKPLFEKLREAKINIFASTGSNTQETKSRLKTSGILDYFSLVLGDDEIPKGQKHFEKFAKYLKIDKKVFNSRAFFYSDGPSDMAIAKKFGIFAVGVTNTVDASKLKSAEADLTVSSAADLFKKEL